MNILLLCTQSPFEGPSTSGRASVKGGAEISLKLIGEMLAERGHNVYFLTKGALTGKRRVNDVTVIHKGFFGVPLLSRWSEAFKRFNKGLDEAQWERHIQRLIRRHDIQIIHSYVTYPDTYVAVRAGMRNGVPVVQRIAGLFWKHLWDNYPSLREEISFTFENVDHFLPNSVNLSDALTEFTRGEGIGVTDRLSILDIGIDMKGIDAIRGGPADIGPKDPFLLCVASFKPYQKRQDILVDALGMLRDRGTAVNACFIGGGQNKPEMERRVERLDLAGHVRFLGNMRHDDVIRVMRRATAYVHPTDFEGLSKAIAEAMYLGLPIVASDVPGVNDLLTVETAMLSENSPESFANSIELLLRDPSIGESIGRNARKFALERLDPDRNAIRYERLFQRMIAES